jgi:hypothetical protein
MKSRIVRGGWLPLLLLILSVWLVMPTPVWPAAYWFHGVRSRDVTVCFAGNAVTARPARVREIVGHLQRYQYAANVKFKALSGKSLAEEAGPTGNLNALGCPAPTQQPNGTDSYAGDVRVALWSTNVDLNPPGMVPGVGCTQPKVASSWSNPPDELELKRACQYNLVLGDDADSTGTPYLNHTLHEFGHALGLVHEHARTDENAQCVPASSDEYHAASSGFITPYDKNSVMHYWWSAATIPNCQHTGTNYSQAGLTGFDALAVHIMYPEDIRAVEFYGDTVIRRESCTPRGRPGKNMGFVKQLAMAGRRYPVETPPSLSLAGLGPAHTPLHFTRRLSPALHLNGTVRVLSAGHSTNCRGNQRGPARAMPQITSTSPPLVVRYVRPDRFQNLSGL